MGLSHLWVCWAHFGGSSSHGSLNMDYWSLDLTFPLRLCAGYGLQKGLRFHLVGSVGVGGDTQLAVPWGSSNEVYHCRLE